MNRLTPVLLFILLLSSLAALGEGVWREVGNDTSDFWCPLTDSSRAYSSIPACPANPEGAACSSGYCRVNTITSGDNIDSKSCLISTELYECRQPSEGSCPLVETSPGGCTQTGTQWDTFPNYSYGGNATQQWGAQSVSCMSACQSSGANFCTERQVNDLVNNTVQYSCWAVNGGGYQQSPPQTTTSQGEVTARTTHTLAVRQAVYACTAPTYACEAEAAPPTASLSADPVSMTEGQTSTLTHACTNATSASIDQGIGSVSATSGTRGVSPSTTTAYTLTCTGQGGTATAQVTVAVTPPPIIASCQATPTALAQGGTATWTATASGGTGSYAYAWSGTDDLSGSGASIAKTYATAGAKTASVTVTSGTQSSTVNCSNSVQVDPPAQPDLTAGNVSGGPGTVGTPVTLSATISNAGSAGTGAGFTNLFQRATDSSGGNATDIGTDANAALAAGGAAGTSLSYSFPSAGTWYVRVCADKSSSGNAGVIAESNEGNNCSASWVPVTVSAAPPDSALSCSASATSVPIGGSVTYTASGASSPYAWTPSDGVGSYGTGSTASRTFTTAGSYGMTVSKSGYASGNCPVVTAGSGAPSCGTASAAISASPDRVREGNTTTVSWSASGVDTSCTITGTDGYSTTIPANACTVPDGSTVRTINAQTVYRINCDSGESVAEVVVNLIPKFIEF